MIDFFFSSFRFCPSSIEVFFCADDLGKGAWSDSHVKASDDNCKSAHLSGFLFLICCRGGVFSFLQYVHLIFLGLVGMELVFFPIAGTELCARFIMRLPH